MRRFAAATFLTIAAALPVAAQFEGTITMKGMGGTSNEMKYYIKGDKVAFTTQSPMGGGDVRGIIDVNANKMTMVMAAEGQMAAMKAMPGMEDAKGFKMTIDMGAAMDKEKATAPVPKDLGTSETIAGYKCEDYEVTDGKNVTKLCVSHELGHFAFAGSGTGRRGGAAPGWTRVFGDKPWFPLKVWSEGKPAMEVTSVSKGPVPASIFEIPDGYKEMPMMGGRGGL